MYNSNFSQKRKKKRHWQLWPTFHVVVAASNWAVAALFRQDCLVQVAQSHLSCSAPVRLTAASHRYCVCSPWPLVYTYPDPWSSRNLFSPFLDTSVVSSYSLLQLTWYIYLCARAWVFLRRISRSHLPFFSFFPSSRGKTQGCSRFFCGFSLEDLLLTISAPQGGWGAGRQRSREERSLSGQGHQDEPAGRGAGASPGLY